MATDKQRFSITVDDSLYKKIDDFRFQRRIKSQSKAVNELMEMGFDAISGNDISVLPTFSPLELGIIEKYNALDSHGREVVDFLLKKEYERCQLAAKNGKVALSSDRDTFDDANDPDAAEAEELSKSFGISDKKRAPGV